MCLEAWILTIMHMMTTYEKHCYGACFQNYCFQFIGSQNFKVAVAVKSRNGLPITPIT